MVVPSISAAKACSGVSVDASVVRRVGDPGRRDPAADDALAGIGLEPIDPRRLVGQPLPDRQQQPGDDVDRAVGELRHLGEFGVPGRCEGGAIGFVPMALVHHACSEAWCCSIGRIRRTRRSTSPSSSMTLGAGTCTAARPELLVDQQHGARIARADRAPRSSVTGRLRSRRVMVSSRVSAPVPGWV